ncbi:hypothetical protein HAX54_045688 [Datura stramonium]|uniref:Disease resistance R13L4/SHOC-2-like LRR domain-containing protein n=1 Tax=Datura stramonium TaxID=4076 RepID=A0ABS8RQ57_DATST|nr:hypothetical protein [Datura stramonium]
MHQLGAFSITAHFYYKVWLTHVCEWQGLDSVLFEAKQKDKEKMGAQISQPTHSVGESQYAANRKKTNVSPSRFSSVRRSIKYKITDVIHRSLQNAPQLGYLKVREAQLGSVSEQIQHLFLISQIINPASFKILGRFEHLHTLFCQLGSSIGPLPHDFFYSVKQLRSLGLHGSSISEIPTTIGILKYLRYLDVSGTSIEYLPESIDNLDNLRTLKLGCLKLVRLPLHMGNLTSLQTLRAFVVGRDDGCRIEELKNLNNISGSFCISKLENVLTSHEAKEAAMTNKKYIRKLELR